VWVVLSKVLPANQDSFLECFLQLQKLADAKQRANAWTTTNQDDDDDNRPHARCYCCTRKLFCM
jgi:hypothetical protein